MNDIKELLDFEIYPNLDRAEAVLDLNPKDKGNYYLITCPECGKREAYLYKDGLYIKCNRLNKCGSSVSLWDHIQTTKGLTNQETLQELARLADYTLPDLKGYSEEKAERSRERANLFEAALTFFKVELWQDGGERALGYLKTRGYTEDEVRGIDLGFYPGQKRLEAHLVDQGYSGSVVKDSGLRTRGFGGTHKVVIPYRDPVGRLKGFIVRAIDEQVKPKYLFSSGVEKDSFFNFNQARGNKDLVVVEGFLDALIATQRGVKGVVATGGAEPTKAQIENAVRYGTKYIVLALDNDEAGQKGTERALDLISRKGLNAFVVSLPDRYKDPDELIKKQGIEVFKKIIEEAQSGAKWKASRILSKQSLHTDRGKQEVLDEALAYEETLRDPVESKDFLDTVTEALDLPPELLEPKIKDYHEKKARERLNRAYQDFFRDGLRLSQDGDLIGLRLHVDENLSDLMAKGVARTLEPYGLQSLLEDIAETPEGLRTGYPSLDGIIRIPHGAITIIAGRPSHGKTTFLMNLLLNMTKLHQDKTFLFFSYEEPRNKIGIKLLNILGGKIINLEQNLIQIENYLKGGNTREKEIELAKQKFKSLTENGRLWIIDEPYFVHDLADTIAYLRDRYNIGAVFIDYIQKIKIKGRYPTRQVELQKVSERILETAKGLSLPIILGAQLGRDKEHRDKVRLDNLREAGDIEQDANLVIGLYNPAMEKAQDEGERLKDREVDLRLTILKNRNGLVNEEVVLSFDRPILTIGEKEKQQYIC